jgi:hypothetical protein
LDKTRKRRFSDVPIRTPWVVDKQAWRWAVEIDQIDGQQFVRVIDDGKVSAALGTCPTPSALPRVSGNA